MRALTVYKASAGSGKTFTLATEYIKLLIANPQCYRSILAVTFTNKATEEMKQRIVKELAILAGMRDEKSNYLETLCDRFNATEDDVRKAAKRALTELLFDYSNFNVSTIDSFF